MMLMWWCVVLCKNSITLRVEDQEGGDGVQREVGLALSKRVTGGGEFGSMWIVVGCSVDVGMVGHVHSRCSR